MKREISDTLSISKDPEYKPQKKIKKNIITTRKRKSEGNDFFNVVLCVLFYTRSLKYLSYILFGHVKVFFCSISFGQPHLINIRPYQKSF